MKYPQPRNLCSAGLFLVLCACSNSPPPAAGLFPDQPCRKHHLSDCPNSWGHFSLQAPEFKSASLLPVYLIGSLAAYWCFERAFVLFD